MWCDMGGGPWNPSPLFHIPLLTASQHGPCPPQPLPPYAAKHASLHYSVGLDKDYVQSICRLLGPA